MLQDIFKDCNESMLLLFFLLFVLFWDDSGSIFGDLGKMFGGSSDMLLIIFLIFFLFSGF